MVIGDSKAVVKAKEAENQFCTTYRNFSYGKTGHKEAAKAKAERVMC